MNVLNTIADRTAQYNMMKTAQEDPTSWTGMAWWGRFYFGLGLMVLIAIFFAVFYFFGKREKFENQENGHWLYGNTTRGS
jgi:hypothetical protein